MIIYFIIGNKDKIIQQDLSTIKELSKKIRGLQKQFPTEKINVRIGNFNINGLVVNKLL